MDATYTVSVDLATDGGLQLDQAKRLKDLEREHARLKKLVAEQVLDNDILREAARGNFCARRRRRAVTHVQAQLPISERRACRVLQQPRPSQR